MSWIDNFRDPPHSYVVIVSIAALTNAIFNVLWQNLYKPQDVNCIPTLNTEIQTGEKR